MKEMAKKPDATQIILEDNDFTLIIRRMIEEATQKEYSKTAVLNAISQMWGVKVPKTGNNSIVLTEQEKEFFEKVDLFYEEYGFAFVRRMAWKESDYNWQNREMIAKKINNPDYSQKILYSLKVYTKCIYCSFCREDTINMSNIMKYKKELVGYTTLKPIITYPIRCALDDFYIYDGKIFYTCEKRTIERIQHSIEINKSYQEFTGRYQFRNTEFNQVCFQLIWVISTFF